MGTSMTNEKAPTDRLEKLLTLVNEMCTKTAIQGLLRKAKDANSAIRVSGSKDQVVANLREAIDRQAIQIPEVYSALCAGEENGSQHIFYYVPKPDFAKAECDNGELVAEKLLGKGWRGSYHFPAFHLEPEGVVWSDFRIDEAGWTAKMYAGPGRWTFVKKEREG